MLLTSMLPWSEVFAGAGGSDLELSRDEGGRDVPSELVLSGCVAVW